MELKYAEQIIRKAFPDLVLTSVLDYKEVYIFNTIPKGVTRKQAVRLIRPPICIQKSDGKIRVFEPHRDVGKDFSDYAKNTIYY